MMRKPSRWAKPWILAAVAIAALGCTKEEEKASVKSAAKSEPSSLPAVTPPVTSAVPAPSATVEAPKVDCPKGSSGEGTFNNPCEAKGPARMMEVTWTGKMDDEKGPTFRVINKSDLTILHGKIAVYFYDKAGKQLEVPPPSGSTGAKSKPFHSCGGSIFGGIMKPGEKAVFTFSCVKKSHVPEGTTAIEAEMQTVGIADATEKRVDYYWRNNDLTPDERKKGGIKK